MSVCVFNHSLEVENKKSFNFLIQNFEDICEVTDFQYITKYLVYYPFGMKQRSASSV